MASKPDRMEIAHSFLEDSEIEVALKGMFDYVESEAQQQVQWYWSSEK